MLLRITTIGKILIYAVVPWVVVSVPLALMKGVMRAVKLWLEIFSVPFLVLTLFSPWKRITDLYHPSGFNISRWAQALTLNLTSRMMGAIVRCSAIVFSLACLVMIVSVYLAAMAVWIGTPIVAWMIPDRTVSVPLVGVWLLIVCVSYLRSSPYQRADKRSSALEAFVQTRAQSEDEREIARRWFAHRESIKQRNRFFGEQTLIRLFGGFGRSWVTGFTDELQSLTEEIKDHGEFQTVLHGDKIQELSAALIEGDRDNAVIVGRIGSGKQSLILHLARTLRTVESRMFKQSMQVRKLRTDELLSAHADPDAFLLRALKRAESAGNVILVIEDLSPLLSQENASVVTVLNAFLSAPSIHVIAYATPESWRSTVKSHPIVESQFVQIELPATLVEEALPVLMEEADLIEERGLVVTVEAIQGAARLADRHIKDAVLPGSAVRLLKESVVEAVQVGEQRISSKHVVSAVSRIAHIDLSGTQEESKEELMNLQGELGEQIIGQDSAVQIVSDTLKKAKQGLGSSEKPLSSFLFLGPTGVGKTEMAKAIALQAFGSEDRIVRIDLNHYATADAGKDLSGDRETEGSLVHAIEEHPSSVVLLDEIEKAHPSVLDLFLQVIDEGILTDHDGRETDFRSAIIVATSNGGAPFITELLNSDTFDAASFKDVLIQHLIREEVFRPEFLNRFDAVVAFQPLSEVALAKIAATMISEVANRYQVEQGLTLVVSPEVLQEVIKRGSSVQFGAREMQRAVADVIENTVSSKLLEQGLSKGDTVEVRVEDIH